MAVLIPDLDPVLIENSGEQRFYEAAAELPAAYTVYYSYKFVADERAERSEQLYEADFIIVHPYLGYVAIEVKEGQYHYFNNSWQKLLGSGVTEVEKDPVEQAKRAMYSIFNKFKREVGQRYFPLKFRYAVCFPDCRSLTGVTPDQLTPEKIILCDDLEKGKLESKLRIMFGSEAERPAEEAVRVLNKILAPSFKVFSDLESKMEMFHLSTEKVLTEEQERILDETEYDRRKIFLGPASTGKTFIAMEKVRRLVGEGKKVLLTCFNRQLGVMLRKELAELMKTGHLTATNYHDLLMNKLKEAGYQVEVPQDPGARAGFFRDRLPELGFDYAAELEPEDKYDALVIDEGQDFREDWFLTLQGFLKGGEEGECYIFADPAQTLFNPDSDALTSFDVSRHRLTQNLRNTEVINDWLSSINPGANLRCRHRGGVPVGFFPWQDEDEELHLITKELGRLVSQKVQPGRVVLLSPNVMMNSAFSGREKLGEWLLVDVKGAEEKGSAVPSNAVRFYTIRSYKGLESDIVFLTGIKESQACTPEDVYVGCSRARFLLYIFHQEGFSLR